MRDEKCEMGRKVQSATNRDRRTVEKSAKLFEVRKYLKVSRSRNRG